MKFNECPYCQQEDFINIIHQIIDQKRDIILIDCECQLCSSIYCLRFELVSYYDGWKTEELQQGDYFKKAKD